jgi:hypothetical protein
MSIQSNFPSIAPTLNLSFALTKALDPRITFTRASTATYYGTQTAKAEENLVLRSQEFDNASWVKTRLSVTANTTTAPDGTTTAETLTGTGVTGSNNIQQAVTPNGACVASVFAKANTNNFIQIAFTGDNTSYVNFDVSTGVVGTADGTATGSIVSVGDGWYRCVVVNSSTAVTQVVLALAASNSQARLPGENVLSTSVFIWGAQLEQRSAVTAYTPTTTQPITNYIPVLQTAASGVARFDHNPTTFESLGLLIEEQRTNLLLRSEEFDNAYYTKSQSSIVANTVVAPDGALTGDKLVEDTTNNSHRIFNSSGLSAAASTAYTGTVYAKAGERSRLVAGLWNGSNYQLVQFDLANGTVLQEAAAGIASITSVGNGWYRCSVTRTPGAVTTFWTLGTYINATIGNLTGVFPAYTGDGFSGIYIWGAQLEAGAFPTSYIPTVASQVTRAADAASMTGANFSSWYRQDQGSFYAEAQSAADSPDIVVASDTTVSNRFGLLNNNTLQARVTRNGVSSSGDAGTFVAGFNKVAGSASVSDGLVAALNGATSAAASISTMPPLNTLYIGSGAAGGFVGGVLLHIRKIAYYPIRVTNAQLQGLTS